MSRKNWFYNYEVYDIENGYNLIFQNEKIKEIVKFLGMPQSTISSSIRRNNAIRNKYKIIKKVKSKVVEVVMAYDIVTLCTIVTGKQIGRAHV